MIESTAIRYFRVVTEAGSIKQAAAALRIAPSAISRQVQGLEEELAVKLFERGARGMNLTDAGHVLYRYAVENRNQLDGLRSQVEEFASLRRGQVKIATVEGMLSSFLPNSFVDLSQQYPGIALSVTAVGARDVVEMVSQNEVDLGLIFGRAPRRDLIELGRMRQPVCLIVAPTHPLASQKSYAMKDLAGLRAILPDASFGIRQELDKSCAQANVRLEICSETNSLAFTQTVAARTDLATFLPMVSAMASINAGTLVAIPPRDRRLESTQVTLVQSAARMASPSTRLVAEMLVAQMKDNEEG
ncbi:LysR family transcriptional regulator [Tardiphaga sp. P9-11]|jgi:DNA-binding transcriptional LysR family regulator|uniref:LysR family transcriptional regulator n=1 Tax=Tardiphaga sp. P9-11 TaxID=2024614 RepID=UPI0011F1D2D7|nr:LysR family transcriptional regulator [Tardiphaga sp. P9-11]KAA0073584.1 LysR family transcriptional regulator [Tardiphaga sp. P9-11]